MTPDVIDTLAAAPPPTPPPIDARLAAELAQLAPVVPRRPARQLAMVVVVSLAYAGALLALQHARSDLGELPVAWLVAAGAAWLAGFVVPCTLVLVPRRGSMMPHWRAAAAVALAAAVLLPMMGLAIHPSGPSSLDYGWAHVLDGRGCLGWGLIVAVLPVVVGVWCVRGVLAVRSHWACAAIGAGAGSLGGLLLHLHCRIADAAHIGVVHGGVVAVAAVLAAVVGPPMADRPLR